MSVIYKGKAEIEQEDLVGLQKVARVLKVELPEYLPDDEEEGLLDVSGIIAMNSSQALMDISLETIDQLEEVEEKEEQEETAVLIQKLPISNSKSLQRSKTIQISHPQRTRKRKSVKVDEEEDYGNFRQRQSKSVN
jgi:hypothetical protein